MSIIEPDVEFRPFPKLARLRRDITITEKIDGTNACVIVSEEGWVAAQSRKRVITPQDDNFGFAAWVFDNMEGLAEVLGPGYHYGEWWGAGIQRGYGGKGKTFSLFNTTRWSEATPVELVPGLDVVPVLYEGPFCEHAVDSALADLREYGSQAAIGYPSPEGIVVYHHAANSMFKVTLENDEVPKGLVSA